MKRKYYTISLLIVAILAFIASRVVEQTSSEINYDARLSKLESKLSKEIEKLKQNLGKQTNTYDYYANHKSSNKPTKLDQTFQYFVFHADSMVFWSTNAIPLSVEDANFSNDTILLLKNGWYFLTKQYKDDFTFIGAFLIKNNYKYTNSNLKNNWHKKLRPSANAFSIALDGEYKLSYNDAVLLSLSPSGEDFQDYWEILIILLYITAIVCLIAFIKLGKKAFSSILSPWLLDILGILILSILRYAMFNFRFPTTIYSSKLFGPYFYATSDWLPSLGDLLLNVLLLLYISLVIFKKTKIRINPNKNVLTSFTVSFVSFLFLFVAASITIDSFEGLIINSNIEFNIKNVFTLNLISYLGFAIIAIILLIYTLIAHSVIKSTGIPQIKSNIIILSFLIALIAFIALDIIYFREKLQFFLPFIAFLIVMLIRNKRYERAFNFSTSILYILIFSAFATFALNYFKTYKEKEYRKILAIDLSTEKDPIGESIFLEIEQNIKNDQTLKNTLKAYPDRQEEAMHIVTNHFKGYWSKYDILVTLCSPDENLIIKPSYYETNCHDFFDEMVTSIGQHTLSSNLYYLENNTGRNSYLATFNLKNDSSDLPKIIVELNSKYVPKDLGYPELLIDEKTMRRNNLNDYSYAKYRNNELFSNYGKYFYNISLTRSMADTLGHMFYDLNGYNHLSYRIDKDSIIIISKKRETFLDRISPFSYLFILFSIICFLFVVLVFRNKNNLKLQPNLKSRIQFAIIVIVLISFFLIGSGSIYYIYNIYNKKNVDFISEKMHSLLVELEHKLSEEKELTPEMSEYLTDLLIKFQNVFFTDINMFDLKGNLLASSRPKIFSEGLIAPKMNTEAFNQLKKNKQFFYLHEENIGHMEYLSAYVPFRNELNEHIAYLNIPYFAKQNELQDEISSFLVTFVNVFLLLIALAVIIALIISAYITKPLQLIKEKLSKVIYGKQNEKIEWNKSDELGSLIVEYNRMVDELVQSAMLLAQSERESAWREMAKQVAHEIKNPLTPMKLNVQYLQRAWLNKEADWDKRLARFSESIIEQIDTLSKIASEFSDFAKMPQTSNQVINLFPVLQRSVDLYIEDPNLSISLESKVSDDPIVFADKEQLLRVFNNMIKNAIQAKKKNIKCLINIIIESEEQFLKISVADNGKGIPEELKGKIFSPNFTTKSSGMGLGLAMVHNIISSAGGKIDFDSEQEMGTTFHIWLPKYKG